MKSCKSCGKKFGFFEKIYTADSGDIFCEICMKEGSVEPTQEEGTYVNLNNESLNNTYDQQYSNQYSTQSTRQVPEKNNYVNLNVPSSTQSDEWEFRVIKLSLDSAEARRSVSIEKIEKVINKMGTEGWELVSVIPLNVLLVKKDGLDQPAMIFKRKKDKLNVKY
ncbi:DUF4177 domain-containing protein [Candidatus Woesearchaeota archaeon]|nr:DUF4177 domain-containing protein [Candidatus Woesearchaeota archaeon]